MTETSGALKPDVQPTGQHLSPNISCVEAATSVARDYAARVRFYSLIAGVGDEKDVEAARETVKEALLGINFHTERGDALRREEDTRAAYECAHADLGLATVTYRNEIDAAI